MYVNAHKCMINCSCLLLVRVCEFRYFFTQVMKIYVNVHTEYGQNIKPRACKSV